MASGATDPGSSFTNGMIKITGPTPAYATGRRDGAAVLSMTALPTRPPCILR